MEGTWSWKFDSLRGKFDQNNTNTITIFMITLAPYCWIWSIWTPQFAKKFLPQLKISAVPCFAIEIPRAISSISSPQFWRKNYRILKYLSYPILRLYLLEQLKYLLCPVFNKPSHRNIRYLLFPVLQLKLLSQFSEPDTEFRKVGLSKFDAGEIPKRTRNC
jgi:hypothetical protein